MRTYQTSMLDGVLQESNLRWLGCGSERVAFCFEPDIDLLGAGTPASADEESEEAASDPPMSAEHAESARPTVPVDDVSGLFPDPFGRYDIQMLQRATGMSLPPWWKNCGKAFGRDGSPMTRCRHCAEASKRNSAPGRVPHLIHRKQRHTDLVV